MGSGQAAVTGGHSVRVCLAGNVYTVESKRAGRLDTSSNTCGVRYARSQQIYVNQHDENGACRVFKSRRRIQLNGVAQG